MKCSTCSGTAIMGKKTCRRCLDKAKKRSKERYKKIKLERICKSCPNKVSKTKGIYCESCQTKQKDAWYKRKKSGVCVTCAKKKAEMGLKCKNCYKAYINNTKNRRERRLGAEKCAFCEEKRINNRLCVTHFLKFAAKIHLGSSKRYKELDELFKKQNGICPYTKFKLTLGADSSIDHIIPKARGGKINDIKNLQWIYCKVNFMKSDLLEEEFIELIKVIHKNL